MVSSNSPFPTATVVALVAVLQVVAVPDGQPSGSPPNGFNLAEGQVNDTPPAAKDPVVAPDAAGESVGEPAGDAIVEGEPSLDDPVVLPDAGDEPPEGGPEGGAEAGGSDDAAAGSAEDLDGKDKPKE